jgi:hypothetical protein
METLLSHPLYLAPVPLYAQLYAADALVVDDISPFVKQTYRSRAVIAAESGAQQLAIPVIHDGGRVAMRDVRISEHGNWRHQHWNALVSSYRQTPYFDYYEEDFFPFYHEHRWERLAEFNCDLHQTVMRLLEPYPLLEEDRRINSPYYQMFASRHGFIENLSIVDLLFNMGPESVYYL